MGSGERNWAQALVSIAQAEIERCRLIAGRPTRSNERTHKDPKECHKQMSTSTMQWLYFETIVAMFRCFYNVLAKGSPKGLIRKSEYSSVACCSGGNSLDKTSLISQWDHE